MARLTSTLAVLAIHNCNSRKCPGAELDIYSVLAFESTMTLCKMTSYFSLLVKFGRWIKRGFIKWFKEIGSPHEGEGAHAYVRSHGCSHRTKRWENHFFPQPAVPSPVCLCLNCCVIEMNLTFRKKKQNVTFFSTHSLWINALVVWYTGTKEPLMARGVPRKRWCHLGRHCSRNSPRGFLLSFPPAPDQRPQGKWILGGGRVSCCERMLVCFTAISQRLCSFSENWSSIINSLVSVEGSRAVGSSELKEALQSKQKKALRGK